MQKFNLIFKAAFLFFFACLLIGCEQGTLINDTQKVPEGGWNSALPLRFRVDINDTMQKYNCFISVRHTKEYAWMNIFFFIKTTFPDKEVAIDTVECVLADLHGKWTGKSFGKYLDNQFLFKQNIRFPQDGSYTIEIYQGMRTDKLKNMENVGLKIIPSNIKAPNIPEIPSKSGNSYNN